MYEENRYIRSLEVLRILWFKKRVFVFGYYVVCRDNLLFWDCIEYGRRNEVIFWKIYIKIKLFIIYYVVVFKGKVVFRLFR